MTRKNVRVYYVCSVVIMSSCKGLLILLLLLLGTPAWWSIRSFVQALLLFFGVVWSQRSLKRLIFGNQSHKDLQIRHKLRRSLLTIDCSRTSEGLFAGFGFVVVTILAIAVFNAYSNKKEMAQWVGLPHFWNFLL